jgi:hypothetical protein
MPATISQGRPSGAVVTEGHHPFGKMTDLALLGHGMTSATITIKTEKITGMLEFIIDGMNQFLNLGPGVAAFAIGLLMAYRAFRTGRGIREQSVCLMPTGIVGGGQLSLHGGMADKTTGIG